MFCVCVCVECWGLLWLCVCLSLHRDTGNCATLIPAIGTVCLAPLYNADKLQLWRIINRARAHTHTYTHALFIVWRCCKKGESVEVVVEKKHETREKMVSSKNWQTLESFFYLPWYTHILTQRFVQEEGSVHAVCLCLAGFLFHWSKGWWRGLKVIMIMIHCMILTKI